MVIDLTVGLVWCCPCGWTRRGDRGAAQLVREHARQCSYAHRTGQKLETFWEKGITIRDGHGRTTREW